MVNPVNPLHSFHLEYCHPQNNPFLVRKPVNVLCTENHDQINKNSNKSSKNGSLKDLVNLSSWNPLDWLRDNLIFIPSKKVYSLPQEKGIKHEEVFIDTHDGEKLHGYFLPAKKETNKVVIFLHGHDLNVSRWFLAPVHLQEQVDVNFLVVDYRGYGKSSGKPTSKGLVIDSLAMYEYLKDKGYKSEDISVYGRSLGGGVALELASRVQVKSVIVQSSFSSMKEVIKFHLPYLPSFLIRNNLFNSEELIKKINAPVLISHGTMDERIPIEQVLRLYGSANEPKKLVLLPGAGHEHLKDFYTEEYFSALKELFL